MGSILRSTIDWTSDVFFDSLCFFVDLTFVEDYYTDFGMIRFMVWILLLLSIISAYLLFVIHFRIQLSTRLRHRLLSRELLCHYASFLTFSIGMLSFPRIKFSKNIFIKNKSFEFNLTNHFIFSWIRRCQAISDRGGA